MRTKIIVLTLVFFVLSIVSTYAQGTGISAFTELTAPESGDTLVIVDGDVGGTTKKITVLNLVEYPLLTSAPASPESNKIYRADCSTWNPASIGCSNPYFAIYDGSNWYAWFEFPNIVHTARYHKEDPVIGDPDGWTMSGNDVYGGTWIATAAGTGALPDVASGMNLCVMVEGVYTAVLSPHSTDTIYLDGAAESLAEDITSDGTSGAMVCLQYRSANSWSAWSFNWDGAVD